GPLAGDCFERGGRSGRMKQHGFARLEPWTVVGQAGSESEVTLELVASEATRAVFPWEFALRLRYALAGATLTVETRIDNRSDTELPFALGFHPYFHVPDAEKAAARIETDATRAFDNVTKTVVAVQSPLDLTQKEVDLHLADHSPHAATLQRGERDRIVVAADPAFGRWVIWTIAGKDFVCLEPWTAAADALNTGKDLLGVAPGASRTLTMSIAHVAMPKPRSARSAQPRARRAGARTDSAARRSSRRSPEEILTPRRHPVFRKGLIAFNDGPSSRAAERSSYACWRFIQNSGVVLKTTDSRSAVSAVIARRSPTSSVMRLVGTPIA
ncbi:MAG TPA: hypothetical protein VLT33_16385, partial [Labilithrix sp.]|nr:hypothetical protein [Labilithrix sp.]